MRGCLGYANGCEQTQPREDSTNAWVWVLDWVRMEEVSRAQVGMHLSHSARDWI